MTQELKSEAWRRIQRHAGETFTQIRGGEFTYRVKEANIYMDRTHWVLPRSHVDQALEMVPLENTMAVQHLFAPSYAYAIVMDDRIRLSDW